MGIVSAKGRSNVRLVDYENFIQTDAAINPGSSGGALINLRGELVGVNTAIAGRSGEYQGIGFAIPSNMAKSVMGTLAKGEKIVRGWLGVRIRDINPEMADALGIKTARGVLVSEVSKSGPARKAGLKAGDVIIRVDGREMESANELLNAIAMLGSDKKITLRIFRDGREQNIEVKLAERPADPREAFESEREGKTLDGFEVSPLTRDIRYMFNIPPEILTGVVVTEVEDGSPADDAGLRPGDVIRKINNRGADSVGTFVGEYRKAKDRVLLYVWRDGVHFFRMLRKGR